MFFFFRIEKILRDLIPEILTTILHVSLLIGDEGEQWRQPEARTILSLILIWPLKIGGTYPYEAELSHVQILFFKKVQKPDGTWISVNPDPDAVILNIGDIMQRWTADKFKSTVSCTFFNLFKGLFHVRS